MRRSLRDLGCNVATDDRSATAGLADEEPLWRLVKALAASATPVDVAEALARDGGEAAGGTFANMAILEPGSGRVHVTHHLSRATESQTYDLSDRVPACDAIRDGQTVILSSPEEIAARYPHLLAEIQAAGLSARASAPVRSARGAVLGAIGFGWPAPQAFSVEQLRRVDLIAQLAGLALERGGLNVYFSGVDERKTSELQLDSVLHDVERANSRLSVLATLASELTGVHNPPEILTRLAHAVVDSLADWCTVVVPEGEQLVRVAAAHRNSALDGLARRLIGAYPHDFSGPSPGIVVYRNAKPLRFDHLVDSIAADLDDSVASAAYARTLQLLGDGPGLIMPIISQARVEAILTMVRSSGAPFTEADVATSSEVAARVAAALEDAFAIETQRQVATALQDAALPKALPNTDNLQIAAGYRAATAGTQVGGDWYDAFELETGRIGLVVGDVAGHGVKASALMTQMRNTLRAHLFASIGLSESLHRLSRLLTTQEPDAFATIIAVELDPITGELRWASAGHPSPVVVSRDGTSSHLQGPVAPPIGWMHANSSGRQPEHRGGLEPGDRLLLFTDGLIERRGVDLAIGITHLMIHAEQTHRFHASKACETILRDMSATSHDDDVCLLIADYRPDRGSAPSRTP